MRLLKEKNREMIRNDEEMNYKLQKEMRKKNRKKSEWNLFEGGEIMEVEIDMRNTGMACPPY
jgi:hypothetical protein